MEAKAELRRAIKERLQGMSENDRRVESAIIVRELTKKLSESKMTVAVFIPYLDEPNILPLISEFLERKYVICMPHAEGKSMNMHRIRTLENIGRNSVTNIPESRDREPIDESTIDIVLVPGRAFRADGQRLGRGNGGYDHWISQERKRNPKTRFIGLCFECQIVNTLPTEPHDERMDEVISPRKTYSAQQ